jgi:hypothetical protein
VETTAGEAQTSDTATPTAATPTNDVPADTTGTSSPGSKPATTEATVVPEALQFTAPLVGGGTFDGAAAAGKPTVFWFWAPT